MLKDRSSNSGVLSLREQCFLRRIVRPFYYLLHNVREHFRCLHLVGYGEVWISLHAGIVVDEMIERLEYIIL